MHMQVSAAATGSRRPCSEERWRPQLRRRRGWTGAGRPATLTPQARRLLEGPVLRDAPAAGRPHGGADAAAGRDRRRRGGLRRAAGVARPGRRVPELPAGDADDHPVGRGLRRRGRVGRGPGAGRRAGRRRRASSRGRPWGCPPSWGWPRPPPCCSSGGPSTPRSGPPARRWKPPSSTPTCSSSGPSRSGCSTPPPASSAGAATRRTRPPRAPSGASSRWRSPRSSSSARGPSRGSGSPGRRGRWSAYNVVMAAVLLRAVWAPGSPARPTSARSCRGGGTPRRSCGSRCRARPARC